ncbi:tubulin tyrosine ligase protein, putative [Trypanosoma equiperdum]|uniref:Tubulin tyrosine ligase protein, putative n=2 Tax=Trypanozoon TaxID=39700 RepID=Q38E38_TRYB2|nr:tubulin--tyrosine ligase [Trypanosoma brucei brucei TREU927]EAN76932.1 tubulin tyrosine ligase protein, putative [Trypanosoma brucei brucei TREU927]SCU72483.1 tubulin tyrosine ligase protein, putative [Trypanosoma equiperdum]
MAEPVLPPPRNVATFYPQALTSVQRGGAEDTDILTPETTYSSSESQRIVVGKFVPDPNDDDPSNPKYVPQTALSRVRARLPMISRNQGSISRSTYTLEEEVAPREEGRRSSAPVSNSGANSGGKIYYTLVKPIYSFSAGSLFFPIQRYGGARARSANPGQINLTYHGNDRPSLRFDAVSVQKNNLNRMCLYKLGPGVVAFKVVIDAFEASGMKYTASNELFNVIWAKRATTYILSHLGPYQKVNHFPGTWGIGRKDSLATNIQKMQRYFGLDNFNVIPMTFLLPKQRSQLEDYVNENPDSADDPLIFIVKPSASSCGRGIRLYRGMPPMPTGSKNAVCQRYVGNPMMIFGRKFDLRLYCVVTSFDPLRIYIFDEGLVRFAAQKYPGMDKDLDNVQKHLTNYSVNKTAELNRASRGKTYDSDDPLDIKWCLSDLREFLDKNVENGRRVWEKVLSSCDDVVIKAFLSIEHEVVERLRKECRNKTGRGCFELYGLDLMADDQYNVRLIEVNIMPSLATGTPLDKAVKSRMLAHLLTLIRVVPHQRDAPATNFQQEYGGASPPNYNKRYRFGRHPHKAGEMIRKSLLTRFNDPKEPESILSPAEHMMLLEAEEELACAGGFRRIFPRADNVLSYLPFFSHGVLRNNYLLASSVMMQEKKTA